MGGADMIATFGVRTLKVFMSDTYATLYPNDSWGSPTTLALLAAQTPFVNLFSSANFDTYVIPAWTFANSTGDPWRTQLTATMMANELSELQAFAEHLLTTYAGTNKTFILTNWEMDWAYLGTTDIEQRIPSYRKQQYLGFLRARKQAIKNAIAAVPPVGVSVKFGLELNRVEDALFGSKYKRVLRDILPYIQPDVLDYSCYDTTTTFGADQTEMLATMTLRFTRAIRAIKKYAPNAELVIGEIGWPEEELPGPSYLMDEIYDHAFAIAEAEGFTQFLYWQLWDNECSGVGTGCRGFWVQRPDETYSAIKDAVIAHV
jgi:hypothetical protein